MAPITLGAAVLRLVHIGQVPPDPFYDAAVRSMALSWHNFFFGAFEPGGSVSIDKPPVDLWLQVISVKLLGFSSTTLKLPEAFAGIASVPLLYVVVRRMWSASAGIAAAAAMAVLPIEVITARSDTMDGVMMLVLVLALLAVVRAVETGRSAWLLAGAAALGVAFDVKLLESLVALPGLAAVRLSRAARLAPCGACCAGAAAAVYVAVALSWLTATLLFPAHERPYAIGSTNGSAWNAAFVFNGTDRLGGKSPEPGRRSYRSRATTTRWPRRRSATTSRSSRPRPRGCWRGSGRCRASASAWRSLVALLLGIPALLLGSAREPRSDSGRPSAARPARCRGGGCAARTAARAQPVDARGHRAVQPHGPPAPALRRRLHAGGRGDARHRPGVGGLARRAAGRAVGATCASRCSRRRSRSSSTTASACCTGTRSRGGSRCWRRSARSRARCWRACAAIPARARSLLAPGGRDRADARGGAGDPAEGRLHAIADRVSDAGLVGALPGAQQRPLSAYLLAHQDGARYEVAAESATAVGSLIVQDARPVLVLTTYDARVFTSVAKLKRLIAEGKVRYAFLNTFCARAAQPVNPACSAPARWVRAHGTDVSAEAGLPQGGLLYLLPGAKP